MPGRALREDGSLREASELEWRHSTSPAPNISPLATGDFRTSNKKKSLKKSIFKTREAALSLAALQHFFRQEHNKPLTQKDIRDYLA